MRATVEVYLTEGKSEAFYIALRGFAKYLYIRYVINEDFGTFYDNYRWALEDRLDKGQFDPLRGNFKTFCFSVGRNEATKLNSKNSKKVSFEDYMEYAVSPQIDFIERMDSFTRECLDLNVPLNEVEFLSDFKQEKITPYVFAYIWMYYYSRL